MPILHTARLRLEPLDDRHFDDLHAMNRLPEVMRYITGKPDTPEDTQLMIERVKARWAQYGFSWWAWIDTASGRMIGTGCIQHLGRDPANPLEIGWRMHPDFWHQGYASEAARAMASYAFDMRRAPLLTAVCMPENTPSSTVMTRLGMRYRGRERWYDLDMAVYEMTDADWRARSQA